MPFEAPPWLTMQYQRRSRIPELLLESGRIQAEGAARSGAIWGGAVRDLGGIAAQGVQQYSETKKAEQAAQLEKAQEAAFLDLLQKTEGNPSPMAVIRLYGPERGMKVAEGLRAFQALGEKKGEEALAFLPKLIGGLDAVSENVRAQLYPVARQKAIETGIFPPEAVPEQYDPKAWQEISKFGKSLTAKPEEDYTLAPGAQRRRGDQIIATNPPKPDVPTTGSFEDYMQAPPERRREIEAARKGYQQADDRPTVNINDSRMQWARDPKTGETRLMSNEEIRSLGAGRPDAPARPPTGQQQKNLGFFNRAKQADDDMELIEAEISKLGLAGQARLEMMPNFMQSDAGQKYRQSQRAFTEARLRLDSGAAIPEQEFANDRKTYFVQPGDSPEVIEQKRRARATVLASIGFQAGPALEGFYGDEASAMLENYKTRSKRTGAQPKGGAPAGGAGPKVGAVEGGYRYKGGDPADPASWEKVK